MVDTGTELAIAHDELVASPNDPPGIHFVARIGTFMLECSEVISSFNDAPAFYVALGRALNDDPRVSNLDLTQLTTPNSPNNWPMPRFFRSDIRNSDPKRAQSARALGIPKTTFTVTAPVKNQRKIHDHDSPTETYFAAWDGLTLLVAWECEPGRHISVASGGHVVGEVIRQAARTCGADVFAQGCTTGCEYEFNHTSLLVDVDEDADEMTFGNLCPNRNLHVRIPAFRSNPNTMELHAEALLGKLRSSFRDFAMMKAYGNHARFLWDISTKEADSLLDTQLQRLEVSTGPLRARLKKARKLRGWRRKSRRQISQLWVQIGRIENLRREWRVSRREFEIEAEQRGAMELFEADYRKDATNFDGLDLSALEAQIQHASQRLDNRDLVAATAVGALAGAIAGGAASFLH